ncbi:HisC Histidinol-phosphate/aromatic aminotransferase and cobyric acid decarboxylase [Burkholderiaceae bacterium]
MIPHPKNHKLNQNLFRPSAIGEKSRDNNLLWLDKNENLDDKILQLCAQILKEVNPRDVMTYPELGKLYEKIAGWVGVSPECLTLASGSDGVIKILFETFVERGDYIIHTAPTFAMYPVYSKIYGSEAHEIHYKFGSTGPALNIEELIKKINKNSPKLVCIPNPDSPTGSVLVPDELKMILKSCESAGSILLIDEAYHPFYDWSATSWVEESHNLVVARTFSKAWGLAGLRIGYAVANKDITLMLHKIRPMYEVSTVAAAVAYKMLDHIADMNLSVNRIKAGKEYFLSEMSRYEFSTLPTNGNFVHINFGSNAPDIHEALKTVALYRIGFDHPSLRGYSRFTIAPQPIMERVVKVIQGVMKDRE